MGENKLDVVGSSVPYRGLPIGCCWCAYESDGGGPIVPAQLATWVLYTERGPREVCERHAERGHWRGRRQRVGAVA